MVGDEPPPACVGAPALVDAVVCGFAAGSGGRERRPGSVPAVPVAARLVPATAVLVPVAGALVPVDPAAVVRAVGSGGFVAVVAVSPPFQPLMLAAVRGAVTLVGAKETRVVPVIPVVDRARVVRLID